jgi:hypothetical protein
MNCVNETQARPHLGMGARIDSRVGRIAFTLPMLLRFP